MSAKSSAAENANVAAVGGDAYQALLTQERDAASHR